MFSLLFVCAALVVFAITYRLLVATGRQRARQGGLHLVAAARRSREADRALARAGGRAEGQLQIRVFADWEVQALMVTTPTGDQLLLSAGAMVTLPERERSALLAHELGHVMYDHLDHELRERAAALAVPLALFTFLPLSLVGTLLASGGALLAGRMLLTLELRRHERKADGFARAAGFGRPLARALVRADARDRELAELPLLMARAQRHRLPAARRLAATILRRWEGAAPTPGQLTRWLSGLRLLVGPVRLSVMHRGAARGEIHAPVVVRARRLLRGRSHR